METAKQTNIIIIIITLKIAQVPTYTRNRDCPSPEISVGSRTNCGALWIAQMSICDLDYVL